MSTTTKKFAWKSQHAGFLESLYYMKGRMEGTITSLKLPWAKFNDATTDGLEWHSTTVIGARPGSGKTLMKDQIVRESFRLNPHMEFRVLEFQFEMLAKVSAIREYSSLLGKSYKYLCSAGEKLTKEHLDMCYKYAQERVKHPVDVVEQPQTVNEIRQIIMDYMEHHARKGTNGEKIYIPALITLDHTLLVKKATFEKDKHDMLYNLGEVLTELKRKYPIAFIVLTQLNRDIDRPERNEDGKYGNYILESDIFGSDAMLQHADTVVGLDRPGRRRIKIYGPDRYIIPDINLLVAHFLKCRNGDVRMSFFQAEFERMRINEMTTIPAREDRRVVTKN